MWQQKINLPYLHNSDLPHVISRVTEGHLCHFPPKMLQDMDLIKSTSLKTVTFCSMEEKRIVTKLREFEFSLKALQITRYMPKSP